MPFGEEIVPDTNYRTASLTYNAADNVRQKFTGYQKDDETGLDFAEARMYENRHGRFTAVDPLLASGKSVNPQTFNRYSYVMDSPLRYNDKFGLQAGSCPEGVPGTGCAQPTDDGSIFQVFTVFLRTLNNYLRDIGGADQYDVPQNSYLRERYTSRGPIPDFVRSSEPVGMGIQQFNKGMRQIDEDLQSVPIFSSLYNAQKAGMEADTGQGSAANALGQTGLFIFDLGTTIATGGESRGMLLKNMLKDGAEQLEGFEAHHIVAFADKRAGEARAILERAGIGLNDAVNGVFLKGPEVAEQVEGIAHRSIHTRAYYEEITNRLRNSQNVRETLRQISREISAGTFPY